MVAPGDTLNDHAMRAIQKNFKRVKKQSCAKITNAGKDLCIKMELTDLARTVAMKKTKNLNIFFSIKTDKIGNPLILSDHFRE